MRAVGEWSLLKPGHRYYGSTESPRELRARTRTHTHRYSPADSRALKRISTVGPAATHQPPTGPASDYDYTKSATS